MIFGIGDDTIYIDNNSHCDQDTTNKSGYNNNTDNNHSNNTKTNTNNINDNYNHRNTHTYKHKYESCLQPSLEFTDARLCKEYVKKPLVQ